MIDLKRLQAIWYSFWFQAESPYPIAVFRILFGLLVLQFGWFMSGELHWLLGPKAVVSQSANSAWNATPRINLLALIPHSDMAIDWFWLGFMIAAACLTVGLFTRFSAILVYLALISCDARNSFIFTGADNLLRVESFLLMFSQCGATLSLDRILAVWLQKRPRFGPPEPKSPWALRLLQLQISLCYWAAYSSKINGSTWIDGSAVFLVTHIIEENKYSIPYVYDHLWTCQLLTWFTLVIEFALAVLIWIKELRLVIILIAIPFHLMLDYTLIIPQFQFVMIASLMSFIEPSTYSKIMATLRLWVRKCFRTDTLVVYDDTLDLSCRLAETISRLDLFKLITVVNVRKETERLTNEQRSLVLGKAGVMCISPSAELGITSGVGALVEIAPKLPLLAFLTPLFYFPGCNRIISLTGSLLKRLYPGQAAITPVTTA